MYPQVTQLDTRSAELRAELELIRRLKALEPERAKRSFPSLRPRRATCSV
jgi:hypothetical protein